MATRTEIVKIPIDAKDFEQFAAAFDKFRDSAAQMPDLLKGSEKTMSAMAAQVEKMDTAFRKHHEAAESENELDKVRFNRLRDSEHLWSTMARSSATMARNVLDIGASLLKWGSVLGGGALFGSLFGIDRLAHSIGDTRSASTGYGVSPAALQAFNVNFAGKGIDTNSLLASMTGMETDISKRSPWYALMSMTGHGGTPLAGDTEADTLSMLQGMRDLTKRTPRDQWGLYAERLNLPMDSQGMQRIGGMRDEEWNQMIAAFKNDKKSFGLNDASAAVWQRLSQQIERVGVLLKDKFGVALEGLAPELIKLSSAFGNLVAAFLGSDVVKSGITNLAKWLNELTGEINSGEIRKKFDELTKSTGELIDGFHKLAYAISHPGEAAADAANAAAKAAPGLVTWGWHAAGKLADAGASGVINFAKGFFGEEWNKLKGTPAEQSKGQADLDKKYGFHQGTMSYLEKNWPVTGTLNPEQLGEQFSVRMKKYGGDESKALADMAFGDKQMDQLSKWYGDDWKLNLSPEQQKAINDFEASLNDTKNAQAKPVSRIQQSGNFDVASTSAAPGSGVTVLVINATGGNAAVGLSQLGALS